MSRILLAPMEGLADWVLRDVLTRVGGFSYDDFWKLPVGNCSIAVLSYDGKQLKIEEMGEKVTEWLV